MILLYIVKRKFMLVNVLLLINTLGRGRNDELHQSPYVSLKDFLSHTL